MKRSLYVAGFLAVLLLVAKPAVGSSPSVVGEISGVELCAQFACGAAIFTGTCECEINKRPTIGFFWVAVQHDDLPTGPTLPAIPSAILGGKWNLTTLRGKFIGIVIGGEIVNNGDNSFTVTALLRIQKGGSGDVIATVRLDHDDFPPTVEGALSQPPPL